jgi:hypothetical protein|tara:strand:+ start:477 stop:599 length:123 start_codon:yes stop_codon:yes gene_type:complete
MISEVFEEYKNVAENHEFSKPMKKLCFFRWVVVGFKAKFL